jgi:hypothetical protein
MRQHILLFGYGLAARRFVVTLVVQSLVRYPDWQRGILFLWLFGAILALIVIVLLTILHVGMNGRFRKMIDLGKKAKDKTHRGNMQRNGHHGLDSTGMCKEGYNHDQKDVCRHVETQAQGFGGTILVVKVNDAVQTARFHHAPWNPKTRPKDDKHVRKDDVYPVGLISKDGLVGKFAMHSQQEIKMMQIGIMIKFIGKTVMGVRMLVLPQNGIFNQGHGPNSPFVDCRKTTDGKMARIMPQGTHEPSKDGKEKRTPNVPLVP